MDGGKYRAVNANDIGWCVEFLREDGSVGLLRTCETETEAKLLADKFNDLHAKAIEAGI